MTPQKRSRARKAESLEIGGETVAPGEVRTLEIPAARLPTGTWISLPVAVVNGTRPGPCLWLSAAIHGDEINGVAIIRKVLPRLDPNELRGTIIAVPIVNVFGFLEQTRYLPDRRDLNRCFPGSAKGSLASRLAHLFMTEVVSKCHYGIDLHTGSNHRTNLPQIRANLEDDETRRCAQAFGAPVTVHARVRDGSLREAAAAQGIHVLLYEAGEALRFDRQAIKAGWLGVLRVLAALKMVPPPRERSRHKTRMTRSTTWVRAKRSGILDLEVELGEMVTKKQRLGTIGNTFGDEITTLKAPGDGMVIGCVTNPLVNQGDAIVHLATIEETTTPPQ